MRRLPVRAEEHLAAGYASDDDCRPRPLPKGYGALPGDLPAPRRISGEEALEYGIRQASAGPPGKRFRFLDAFKGTGHRLSPAQTKPRTAYERHCTLLSWLPSRGENGGHVTQAARVKTDLELLKENHRFLRSDADDDSSWEARLAKRYYDRLFKEYVLCDLSGYKKGNVGFRWRTEAELVQGRGQFRCGHKPCLSKLGLRSYEVDFRYTEAGLQRRALVKVRLCQECAYKLHYRRLKAARKRRRKEEARAQRALRKRQRRGDDTTWEEAHAVGSDSVAAGGEGVDASDAGSDAFSDAAKGQREACDSIGREPQPSEAEKQLLESLAWRGPDPAARTREDDFDEYFNDLFL